jgi:phospholipid/cholesterol/gamma-HCH transport system ATP-binding protein
MMADKAILEFRQATVVVPEPYEFGLEEADLLLESGELALVAVERSQGPTPLAEIAQGLIEPLSGEVLFRGKSWSERPPAEAAAARGRIGRVFRRGGWVSNLNVDENITLPLRHHSNLAPGEIRERAVKLGKKFGLAELPSERPALCPRSILRRAEWTRAFLGEPELIILEEPLRDVYSEMLRNLMSGIADALLRGAAALWISGDFPELSGAGLAPLKRYRLQGPRLEEV